jgi:hypothetical protein
VFDTAYLAVSGVRIDVLDGPTAGASATSSADGRFTVSVPLDREFTIRAKKEGYLDAIQTVKTYLTSYGTFFLGGNFSLVSTNVPLGFEPGAYTVTLELPCPEIPADLRTQTFQATVTARPNTPPGTAFIISIDDERFTLKRLEFGVSPSAIGVHQEEDLWWELPGLRYFEALTWGKVGTPSGRATFSTRVDVGYCELRSPKGTGNCSGGTVPGQVLTQAWCPGSRLTLAPR